MVATCELQIEWYRYPHIHDPQPPLQNKRKAQSNLVKLTCYRLIGSSSLALNSRKQEQCAMRKVTEMHSKASP